MSTLVADDDAPPDVSVVLVTYNHAAFVAQAIEGVLAQEGVTLELLIGEDCSTDDTRTIVEEYARRYPGRVRLFLSARNLNTNEVLSRPIMAARGRYIATLDGDDYWTSSSKLLTQVAYLDSRPDVAICFHNVHVVYENGTTSHEYYVAKPTNALSRGLPAPVTTVADVVIGNYLQTCSVLFRRGLFEAFPDWYDGFVVGDWPLHVLNAEHGSIGFIDETLAAYRVHAGGLWSSGMSRYTKREWVEGLANAFRIFDQHFNGAFHNVLMDRMRALYFDAASAQLSRGNIRDGAHYTREFVEASATFPWQAVTPIFRAALRGARTGAGRVDRGREGGAQS